MNFDYDNDTSFVEVSFHRLLLLINKSKSINGPQPTNKPTDKVQRLDQPTLSNPSLYKVHVNRTIGDYSSVYLVSRILVLLCFNSDVRL